MTALGDFACARVNWVYNLKHTHIMQEWSPWSGAGLFFFFFKYLKAPFFYFQGILFWFLFSIDSSRHSPPLIIHGLPSSITVLIMAPKSFSFSKNTLQTIQLISRYSLNQCHLLSSDVPIFIDTFRTILSSCKPCEIMIILSMVQTRNLNFWG